MKPVIVIEPIAAQSVLVFKAIRLRALQGSAYVFGSTYDRESQLSDHEWMERVRRWDGKAGIGFLAMEDENACAIAGAYLEPMDATQAHLVSMWTAPSHRRRGIGRRLVHEVLHWARDRHVHTLLLMVTSVNESAIRFYERLGFTRTGRTEPYPHDPAIVEFEMSLPIL